MSVLTESPVDVQTCPVPTDEITRALCATLANAPDDGTAQQALCDHYQEMGHDRETADALVARVVRWRRVQRAINGSGAKPARLRTLIRSRCGVASCSAIPIRVVGEGSATQAPQMTGEEPYHTFRRGGGICHSPGAARKAGYRTDYHRDTREITVGVAYLDRLISERSVRRG